MSSPDPEVVRRLREVGIDFETLAEHYRELAGRGVREELSAALVVSEIQYLATAESSESPNLMQREDETTIISYVRDLAQ